MRTILNKLWTEPAVFLGAVNIGLQAVQLLVVNNHTVNVVIGLLLVALTHAGIRPLVTPTRKR